MTQEQRCDWRCSFAHAGTYGHECGREAGLTAVKASKPSGACYPPMVTESGLFFTGRCEECAKIKGGENAGVLRIEKYDPAVHVNVWRYA